MMRMMISSVMMLGLLAASVMGAQEDAKPAPGGQLQVLGEDGAVKGACPLKHTDVQVSIAGFIARVQVTQQFHNPYDHKIEAVYTFPLHQDSAVDAMTMKVGERLVRGVIREREEAQQIYQQAKAAGHVASLLDQERPNIFTQSVANIEPGEAVEIAITYSQTLKWEDGRYQFDFPMVVGPRYFPGGSHAPAKQGAGPVGSPGEAFPGAPVTPEGTRAGHDISLTVSIDSGGLPIQDIRSEQHEINVAQGENTPDRVNVELVNKQTIPNRDFVLSYTTAGQDISDALLTHTDERGKFFTLILQPPARVKPEQIVPREVIFVIDSSGSMHGFPIDTAKQAMKLCIDNLQPDDTFNLITFSGNTSFCFPQPVANTPGSRRKAQEFLATLQGSGGTEMMKAIHAALGDQHEDGKLRVVCFMTDGYVGNDMEIIDAVKQHRRTARVFSFGIGSSVNRYLLDGMAEAGRGEVHYVLSPDGAEQAALRFYERINAPVLMDIRVDYAGLPVEDAYPAGASIPDLFSAKPIVIKGRYTQAGKGTITLKGRTGSGAFERKIDVTLPGSEPRNAVLASQWARAAVDHLMGQNLLGVQQGNPDDAMKQQIIALGLKYDLLTQFTSFVAVEEMRITAGGESRTVQVPVEMPQGVSYDGVFGDRDGAQFSARGGVAGAPIMLNMRAMATKPAAPQSTATSRSGPARQVTKQELLSALRSEVAPNEVAADEQLFEDYAYEDLQKKLKAGEIKDPEQQQLAQQTITASKLDRKLSERWAQFRKDGKEGDERLFVSVIVTDITPELVTKLKEAGFTVAGNADTAKNTLVGTIPLKALEKLALVKEVRLISLLATVQTQHRGK